MDIDDLRGLSTIFCMIGFAAIVYWAYGPSRKSYFEEAGKLPFDEEDLNAIDGGKETRDE